MTFSSSGTGAPPASLAVYLGHACNLRCRYCYSGPGEGPKPNAAALLRSLRWFLSAAPAGRKVSFLGGEPLLAGKLLKLAILHIRRSDPRCPVRVFTNGTLLDRAWLAFFSRAGVSLTVSLDGGRAANDAFRRFRRGNKSVFGEALRQLPPGRRGEISVNMVVSPAGAGKLASNALALRRLGFGGISWTPDVGATWSGAQIARLERSAGELMKKYFALLRSGEVPYRVDNIYEALEGKRGARGAGCGTLALAPDGSFYPCDKLVFAPQAARLPFAMRAARGQLDFAPRRAFFSGAAKAGFETTQYCCGVGAWALSRFCRMESSAEAAPRLFSQDKLRKVVSRWLEAVAARGLRNPAFRRAHGCPGRKSRTAAVGRRR